MVLRDPAFRWNVSRLIFRWKTFKMMKKEERGQPKLVIHRVQGAELENRDQDFADR